VQSARRRAGPRTPGLLPAARRRSVAGPALASSAWPCAGAARGRAARPPSRCQRRGVSPLREACNRPGFRGKCREGGAGPMGGRMRGSHSKPSGMVVTAAAVLIGSSIGHASDKTHRRHSGNTRNLLSVPGRARRTPRGATMTDDAIAPSASGRILALLRGAPMHRRRPMQIWYGDAASSRSGSHVRAVGAPDDDTPGPRPGAWAADPERWGSRRQLARSAPARPSWRLGARGGGDDEEQAGADEEAARGS
jgi:hypothetical protein